MRTRPLVLVLAALSLLAGAACASEDDSGDAGSGDDPTGLSTEAQAYADAWAATLTDDDDGLGVSQDDADCMAEVMMAELGVEVFEENGVEPGDIDPEDDADDDGEDDSDDDDSPGELLGAGVISEEQTEEILDGWEGCTSLPTVVAEGLGEELELDEEARECVTEGLGDGELVRDALIPSFTSDDDEPPAEVLSELIEVFTDCAGSSEGANPIVAGMAEDLASDGNFTAEQAECVAQRMFDAIGIERLMELGAGDTDLDDADPAVQQEIAQALLGAAEACDVPLSALSG